MNIKELRSKLNITQQELSDLTGIPRTRIAKWDAGRAHPKMDDYNTLRRFFIQKGLHVNDVWEQDDHDMIEQKGEIFTKNEPDFKDKYIELLEKRAYDLEILAKDQVENLNKRMEVLTSIFNREAQAGQQERKAMVLKLNTLTAMLEQFTAMLLHAPIQEVAEISQRIANEQENLTQTL